MSCKKGVNWTPAETKEFLALCTIKKITDLMDGKQLKHVDIFRILEKDMTLKGFHKTAEQMKLKLKNLKLAYYKCKRDNNKSGAGRNTCAFYQELDLLYGSRPNAEALDSSSGIDTADPPLREDESANNDSTDLTSDFLDDSAQESASQSSVNEPPKKKRRSNLTGRNSYQSMLDSYNKKWIESQEQVLKNMMELQHKQQEEMLHRELQEQRKWGAELLLKEQQFQREQTTLMMQTFMQCMQGIRPPNPQFAPPVKITPMARPVSSVATSSFTTDLAGAPITTFGTAVLTPTVSLDNPTASPFPILRGVTPKVTSLNNAALRPLKTIRLIGKAPASSTSPALPNPISREGTSTAITYGNNGKSGREKQSNSNNASS